MALRDLVLVPRDSGWRWLVVAGTVIAAAAHVPVITGHLAEAPYMGVAFVALTVGCLAIASGALVRDSDLVYGMAELTCGLAVAGFVATRLVAFPLLADDVGHWLEPLAVVSVLAELVVVGAAVAALAGGPGEPAQALAVGSRSLLPASNVVMSASWRRVRPMSSRPSSRRF